MILVAFKAIDAGLRGQGGGFDSHTLPPIVPHPFYAHFFCADCIAGPVNRGALRDRGIIAPPMALALGEKLGPFEILGPLGAGGMGEVYRAWDTRLERTVAIKVLPERASQKPEQRNQLENEARAISKLTHPNICTLHDISHHQGRDFLVLELVEGKTLREVLNAGSLPVRKVIPIAVQIADGLARAHELGIVHRDLKPENLMVSAEAVKILDFGLASLGLESEEALTGDHTADFETHTRPGTILGTLGYMSPEQARGAATDFRSDQFSFGVVLYEMATGRKAFAADSMISTLSAILRDEAQPMGEVARVAPELDQLVHRDRKSTRLNSSHQCLSRMPSSA